MPDILRNLRHEGQEPGSTSKSKQPSVDKNVASKHQKQDQKKKNWGDWNAGWDIDDTEPVEDDNENKQQLSGSKTGGSVTNIPSNEDQNKSSAKGEEEPLQQEGWGDDNAWEIDVFEKAPDSQPKEHPVMQQNVVEAKDRKGSIQAQNKEKLQKMMEDPLRGSQSEAGGFEFLIQLQEMRELLRFDQEQKEIEYQKREQDINDWYTTLQQQQSEVDSKISGTQRSSSSLFTLIRATGD